MEKTKKFKKSKWLFLIPGLVIATGAYMLINHGGSGGVSVYNKRIASLPDAGAEGSDSASKAGLDGSSGSGGTGGGESGDSGNVYTENGSAGEAASAESNYIYVDVGGEVSFPKVVRIKEGSRVFEAVEAAGGLLSSAYTRYMNMAAVCSDGEKIYVPDKAEAEVQMSSSGGAASGAGAQGYTAAGAVTSSGGRININTAGEDELQKLSGIGPSMAKRIIDYRNSNGNFKSIDELTSVKGIGSKILEEISDEICI